MRNFFNSIGSPQEMFVILKRFSQKYNVNRVSKCWEWDSGIAPNGYGQFSINKSKKIAHRVSYILFKSDIPKGMFVCHKCDNRQCVNHDHLFLGTNIDNMNDMKEKGRNNLRKISKNCLSCGTSFLIKKSKEISAKYCSRKCIGKQKWL